ncbi:MAG TPA: Holliday junction branch migration protein RuvA [Flavobacteriales bacterium]|nr:Holliday junction branch migration protein RuvA [Flavobacteriales bacterium]
MIEYLEGKLVEKTPTFIVVDVNGVGYYVHVSLNTFGALGSVEKAKIFIHQVIREDAHLLFGFATDDERIVFKSLLSVNGVGPNTARMILSSLTHSEVLIAISQGNVGAFKRIKGIGEKTAQRILVDLAGKMGKSGDSAGKSTSPIFAEALSALLTLGFDKNTIEKTLDKIIASDNNLTVEQLIKAALKNM